MPLSLCCSSSLSSQHRQPQAPVRAPVEAPSAPTSGTNVRIELGRRHRSFRTQLVPTWTLFLLTLTLPCRISIQDLKRQVPT